MRTELQQYFKHLVDSEPGLDKDQRLAWRLSCFDLGLSYVQFIENHYFAVTGKRVLDVGCAWGGHAVAFASKGAQVYAADLYDHMFSSLARFSREQNLNLSILRTHCERLPFPDSAIDVVLALELIEHIDSVGMFAKEVSRVLRPQGICLISTPARLRSLIYGEPHYDIKGLTILPFFCQRLVATKLFRRQYPYPITRQYTIASRVIQPFASHGLAGSPVLQGRLAELLKKYRVALRVAQELLWSFVVLGEACNLAPSP